MKLLNILGVVMALYSYQITSIAGEAEDMAEMQRKMNAEVAEQPFSVEEEAKIDTYIKGLLKSGLTPSEYKGSHWQPGWTCRNLRRYSWSEYRACRYYRHFHGRYYY